MTDEALIRELDLLAQEKYNLNLLKTQFEQDNAELIDSIKAREADISKIVLKMGETVKTDAISAIWNKGKTTWDGKLLEGYALAHPDILPCRKTGDPTVSFKLAKK